MVVGVEEKFGFYPKRIVGDGAYGNAETFVWLMHEKGIEPHVAVLDKTGRAMAQNLRKLEVALGASLRGAFSLVFCDLSCAAKPR